MTDELEEQSLETKVLSAIDQAAQSSKVPVQKAMSDAHLAKVYSVIAVLGLVGSAISLVGVAKVLDDLDSTTSNYRYDSCVRSNAFREADTVKWKTFIAILTERDPKAKPLTSVQKKRQDIQVKKFTDFLLNANKTLDCETVR